MSVDNGFKVLLPPYVNLPMWLDLTKAMDNLFLDTKIATKHLRGLRYPYVVGPLIKEAIETGKIFDTSSSEYQKDLQILLRQLTYSGLPLNNPTYLDSTQALMLFRNLGAYWYSKGTGKIIDFLNFTMGASLTMVNLWTENYEHFEPEYVEGPNGARILNPSIGTRVRDGGTWYPTTHVNMTLGNTGAFVNVTADEFLQFFNDTFNYNLVLYAITNSYEIVIDEDLISMGLFVESDMNPYRWGETTRPPLVPHPVPIKVPRRPTVTEFYGEVLSVDSPINREQGGAFNVIKGKPNDSFTWRVTGPKVSTGAGTLDEFGKFVGSGRFLKGSPVGKYVVQAKFASTGNTRTDYTEIRTDVITYNEVITLTPTSITSGSTQTLSITGGKPNTTYTYKTNAPFAMPSNQITLNASGVGTHTATFYAPDLNSGAYSLAVTFQGTGHIRTASTTVTKAAPVYNEVMQLASSINTATGGLLIVSGGKPNDTFTWVTAGAAVASGNGVMDAAGNYYNATSFLLMPAGSYTITLTFAGTGNARTAPTNVTAAAVSEVVTISPSTINAGSPQTLTVTGAKPNTTFTYQTSTGGSTVSAPISIDTNGNYSQTAVFYLSGVAAGSYSATLTFAGSGNTRSVTTVVNVPVVITYNEVVTVSPNAIASGASQTYTVSGGKPNTTFTYTLNNGSTSPVQTLDANGGWTATAVHHATGVPAGVYSSLLTFAGSGNTRSLSTTVYNEVLTMASSIASATGGMQTVTGGKPNTTFTATWGLVGGSMTTISGTLDGSGNYTNPTAFIGVTPAGNYTTTFTFAGTGKTRTATTTVAVVAYNEVVTVTPSTILAGASQTTAVTGGKPNTTFTYRNLAGTLITGTLNSSGAYSQTAVEYLVGAAPNTYVTTITFQGSGNTRTATTVVTAPATVTLPPVTIFNPQTSVTTSVTQGSTFSYEAGVAMRLSYSLTSTIGQMRVKVTPGTTDYQVDMVGGRTETVVDNLSSAVFNTFSAGNYTLQVVFYPMSGSTPIGTLNATFTVNAKVVADTVPAAGRLKHVAGTSGVVTYITRVNDTDSSGSLTRAFGGGESFFYEDQGAFSVGSAASWHALKSDGSSFWGAYPSTWNMTIDSEGRIKNPGAAGFLPAGTYQFTLTLAHGTNGTRKIKFTYTIT